MSILQPAQNVHAIGAAAGRFSQTPLPDSATRSGAIHPMFGRPGWSYVTTMAGPVRGPQPRLAQGSGRTGNASLPGNAPQLPGYLSDNDYQPSQFTYDTTNRPTFTMTIPRSINTGEDGRALVGTWKPHDLMIGQRFNNHMRQAPAWQVQEFPPDNRNILVWQQVMKYRTSAFTLSARPLTTADYFLGYQVDPNVAATIGQSTLGYMGS